MTPQSLNSTKNLTFTYDTYKWLCNHKHLFFSLQEYHTQVFLYDFNRNQQKVLLDSRKVCNLAFILFLSPECRVEKNTLCNLNGHVLKIMADAVHDGSTKLWEKQSWEKIKTICHGSFHPGGPPHPSLPYFQLYWFHICNSFNISIGKNMSLRCGLFNQSINQSIGI